MPIYKRLYPKRVGPFWNRRWQCIHIMPDESQIVGEGVTENQAYKEADLLSAQAMVRFERAPLVQLKDLLVRDKLMPGEIHYAFELVAKMFTTQPHLRDQIHTATLPKMSPPGGFGIGADGLAKTGATKNCLLDGGLGID